MSEREFNSNDMNSNDIYSHSEKANDFNENYNDGFSDKQPTAEFDAVRTEAPVEATASPVYEPVQQQAAPSQPAPVKYHRPYGYGYESYTSQFAAARNEAASRQKPKKSGSGRKIAMIACSLILAMGLGVGGGVVGAYLMQKDSDKTSAVQTVDGKAVTASTAEGKDSGLTVIEASNNNSKASSDDSIEGVVAKIKDSVVEITTESTSYGSFYGQYVTKGAGSGVIISQDGYLVTNNHVIDGATNIEVKTTDGKTYKATVVGSDEKIDIALLKIDAEGLTVAVLGDSSTLQQGETSIVIGNPLGNLGGTVTKGIVSALKRTVTIDGKSMELLQTDAAINPGNSGGGMFDASGNLMGIVVAKSATTSDGIAVDGIGFVIPINNVKNILGDLKEKGHVTRPVLGVTLADVKTQTAMQRYGVDKEGVYVASLTKGAAAEKAGIKVGDIITKINGKTVDSSSEISALVQQSKVGDKMTVTVSRDGKEEDIEVTLTEEVSEQEEKNNYSNNFNPGGNNNRNYNGGSNGSDYDDFEDFYRYFMN